MSESCPVCRGTGYEIRSRADGTTAAAPCSCELAERGSRRLRAARVPRRYDHCTLDSFEIHHPSHERARQYARDWVERWPLVEHGLLLLGQPGTGKTHLAVGIVRHLAEIKGAQVLFYEQRELLKALQETFDAGSALSHSEILAAVFDAEVLVLDDLGAGRTTPWIREVLHDIVVHRYNHKKPLLMTSNHPTGEDESGSSGAPEGLTLRDRLGDAIMSRIYEMCLTLTIQGDDYRRGVMHARHQY